MTDVFCAWYIDRDDNDCPVLVEVEGRYQTGEWDVGLPDGWVDLEAKVDGEWVSTSCIDEERAMGALDRERAALVAYGVTP